MSRGVRPASCFRLGRVCYRTSAAGDNIVDVDADAECAEAAFPAAKAYKDRMWVDHTVDAAEMVEMRIKWMTWLRDHGRKCMPDWSICQLHPEDCNLR
jgi:hypothetical protein